MIRFIKDEPFMAPMVLAAAMIVLVMVLSFFAAIAAPESMCQKGFVWVDTPQGRGCVSDQVWKDLQE